MLKELNMKATYYMNDLVVVLVISASKSAFCMQKVLKFKQEIQRVQSTLCPELYIECNSKVSSRNNKMSLEFEIIFHGKQLIEDTINEIFKSGVSFK